MATNSETTMITRKRVLNFQALDDGGKVVEKSRYLDSSERVKGYSLNKEKALRRKSVCD